MNDLIIIPTFFLAYDFFNTKTEKSPYVSNTRARANTGIFKSVLAKLVWLNIT